jgi:hypothetical protein
MSESSELPNISLRRTADLLQIEAIVEMQRQVDREELITLLRFVKETIDDGEQLTPQKVVEDWLVGFPVSSGKRLLRVLEDLGLVQRARGSRNLELLPSPTTPYIITEEGKNAEANDILFMPERLAAVIQYVVDTLIPDRIMSIQTHTERLKDLISKNDRGWNELVEYESIDLPEELKEIVGKEIVVYEGNRAGRVIIDSFGQRVIPSKQTSSIQIDLNLSPKHNPRIKVRNNSRTHDLVLAESLESNLEYKRVLSSLVRQTGKNWSDDKEAISVRFRELDYPQKMSFVTDVQIPTPEIKNLGEFDSCTLKRVPIAPRTMADAQKWYEFRIVEGIDSYLTERGYGNLAEIQKENFTRFGFNLQTPSVDEIIEGYSNIRDDNTYHPVYWFLSATRDLSLGRDE